MELEHPHEMLQLLELVQFVGLCRVDTPTVLGIQQLAQSFLGSAGWAVVHDLLTSRL